MKKAIFTCLALFSITCLGYSQDIITLKTGEQIRSKILEIGQSDIKYKKFDNQSGPVYIIIKSDITNIVYENGTKDVFSVETPAPEAVNVNKAPENKIVTKEPALLQEKPSRSKFQIGFSGVFPTGTWPATALSNMGSTSFLKGQDHTVKSYGFGVLIQGNISSHFSLFFDINTYDYNIFLAKKGADVQTVWTVEESATHWNEAGAPQIQYVHNLATDVHFDMQATGMRLGAKYIVGEKKIRPWFGAAFGYYKWIANYFNADKKQTYGKDEGYATGLTYQLGVDIEIMPGIIMTPFADFASPVANYKMTGLFYPQWDIDYNAHIMGTNRFGLSLSFDPAPRVKK
jgi:hypothetical protein